jgi:hypothetical protein
MSALSVQVPFPVFQDRDGQPLDNGYVFIGTANLNPITNPVVAYFDAALTIIAAQPLRTINGYISRAGSPAQVYVDGVSFSILVQDSKGSMVYSFPSGNNNNASGIVYDPAGAGAVATTVQAKLRESVSVLDFGADPTGITDSTAAFSTAAQEAPAAINIVGAEGLLPRAPMCRILVPAGTYVITSEINTNGREVVWEVNQAAVISGFQFINGEIIRIGQRQADYHHGTTDYATSYSIRSNTNLEDGAEVLGITTPAELAVYGDRDSVSLYVDNSGPPPTVDAVTATYTSTTVTIDAPSTTQLLQYRRGMIVDTKHTPKWSGIIDSWNANGSILTVTAWYQFGGGGTPSTPPNGTGCIVNGFTKVWAHNANVFLTTSSFAEKATGFELGVFNNKGALDFANEINYIWGYDAVNLGTNEGAVAYIARSGSANFFRGFQCTNATQACFVAQGTAASGFLSEQTSGSPFEFIKAAVTLFEVDTNGAVIAAGGFACNSANGGLSLGSNTNSNTPFIDFNSSGNNIDYDVRIVASGGTASVGSGILTITASSGVRFNGVIQSTQDNVHSNGTATNRWSVIYAGTGTINTSDEREKQDIQLLNEAELRVATAIKGLVKKFRFKDAVKTKGDSARIHIGVIAQEIISAFTAEGLDAFNYGIVCFDEWVEQPEQVDAKGGVVQAYQAAGNRYGIRYDELLAFIIAAL